MIDPVRTRSGADATGGARVDGTVTTAVTETVGSNGATVDVNGATSEVTAPVTAPLSIGTANGIGRVVVETIGVSVIIGNGSRTDSNVVSTGSAGNEVGKDGTSSSDDPTSTATVSTGVGTTGSASAGPLAAGLVVSVSAGRVGVPMDPTSVIRRPGAPACSGKVEPLAAEMPAETLGAAKIGGEPSPLMKSGAADSPAATNAFASQPNPRPVATVAPPPDAAAAVAPAAVTIDNGAVIERNEEFTSLSSDNADAHAEQAAM